MTKQLFKIVLSSLSGLLFTCVFIGCDNSGKTAVTQIDNVLKLSKQERMKEAMDHEIEKTKDPKLGTVPYNQLLISEQYYAEKERVKEKTSTPLSNIQWAERGPNNVGGRTRAILFLSATKVLAAGVTGGLWITNDITSTSPNWTPIGDFLSGNINISCIAQDPNNSNILYAGTGEAFGSGQIGSGIYKSIDTGATWGKLNATTFNAPSSNFSYVAKILVASDGNIYAATKGYYCNVGGGLMRSTDGGNNWTRILGVNGSTCTNGVDLEGSDVEENDDGDLFFSSAGRGINSHVYISNKSTHGQNVGAGGNWTDITPTGNWQRMEMGVSKRTASSVMYVACQGSASNDVTGIFYSADKGVTWASRTVPTICDQGSNSPFTRSQAWYDLVVEVDPTNDSVLYIGGIDLMKSTDAGSTFSQSTTWSPYWPTSYGCMCCTGSAPPVIHADQHALVFNPYTANAALSGNDGGLYYSTTMGNATPLWASKDGGFNTSQFYHLATHPTDANYILGGTQDNGSWKLSTSGVGAGVYASGGDGAFNHIHQSNPTYQTTQYVYNNFYLSSNSGASFLSQSASNSSTGRFINPSDMDDANNRVFSAGSADILEVRTGVNNGALARNTHNLGFNGRLLTALTVSPNNTTTLYVGDDLGNVYKITSRGGTPVKSATWNVGASGYISSIDVWKNAASTDDSILVTMSNYGINSVYITGSGTNATPTWVNIDDNNTMQNIPIRWGIFSKEGPHKVFVATDLGILATSTMSGGTTVWTMVNNGLLPRVRVDALAYDADGNLVAATHGRGIWETKEPCNSTTPNLPTTAGTYTSTKIVTEGTRLCFCDANDNLLLVLDTGGSGAVVPINGVSLQIGSTPTISWNSAGGIISNSAGGSILNRKWNVSATIQPSSNVWVQYPFTDSEYDALVLALGSLSSPTLVSSPEQLQLYKMTNGGVFGDPHSTGATGVILGHTGTASLGTWAYESLATGDHMGSFMVSSFSGGGGGGGGGNAALPVSLIHFDVKAQENHTAELLWKTADELNNRGFHIERSFDGNSFEKIDFVEGVGNSRQLFSYSYIDRRIPVSSTTVYYRLVQEDFDGKVTIYPVRTLRFDGLLSISIFPNPASKVLTINTDYRIRGIELSDVNGLRVPFLFEEKSGKIDVSMLSNGTYFLVLVTERGRVAKKFVVDR